MHIATGEVWLQPPQEFFTVTWQTGNTPQGVQVGGEKGARKEVGVSGVWGAQCAVGRFAYRSFIPSRVQAEGGCQARLEMELELWEPGGCQDSVSSWMTVSVSGGKEKGGH